MRQPRQPLGPEQLYDYAVKALGRSALTEKELRDRLARRTPREEHIDEVIERLKSARYLDDQQTAESYARFRLQTAGHGQRRVVRDLARRGLDEAAASSAVSQAYEGQDERALAQRAARRRLKAKGIEGKVEDPREAKGLAEWLERNGFAAEVIAEALADVAEPSEWLESILDALSLGE